MDEKKRKLGLVIDTNLVVASYFNPRSASAKILRLLMDNPAASIVYTEKMRTEMRRILRNIRPPKTFLDEIERIYDAGTRISPLRKRRLVRDDPEDDKFVNCALDAGADYLITNDHHMLELKHIDSTEVLRPTEFVKRLEGEHRERSD